MLATPVTVLTFASVTSAKTLSAQTGALQADEIAIYRVLLRHPEFSGRGLSLAPVVLLRDVRGEFGVILSAATLFNEWQSFELSRHEGCVPASGEIDQFRDATRRVRSRPRRDRSGAARIVSCLGAPSDVAERQTFLFRVGFSNDRQQAITAISNCWTGRESCFSEQAKGGTRSKSSSSGTCRIAGDREWFYDWSCHRQQPN
jgi:hypothetical protein